MARKFYLFLLFPLLALSFASGEKTLHEFKAETIDGKEFDFKSLKGKKVMIVNVASKCGYTHQYEQLEKLYKTYGGEKFTIVAFPANNFKSQEPGTNEEIAEFCKKNFGVTFQIMAKISVKGDDMHPVYKWLTQKEENGVQDTVVRWNFQKFLIDENGRWADVIPPKVSPMDDRIVHWITEGKN
jgi:glutathione peroxidase